MSNIIITMIDLPFFCSELFLKATIPGCMNDSIMNATQCLLKSKYGTPGLQNTLLTTAHQGCAVGGEEFVQVLNSGGNHWLAISTIGCPYSTVNIYDSMCCTILAKADMCTTYVP